MKINEETTVSEEQVLFNKLRYEDQELIIKIMKTLQPCESTCEVEEEKKVEFKNILSLNTNICTIKRYDITDRKNKDRVVCNIRNDFENIGDTVNELIENQKKIIDYLKSKD